IADSWFWGLAFHNDICRRHSQLGQTTIGCSGGLHLHIADHEVICARSRALGHGCSDTHILWNKDRKVSLTHLSAVEKDQVMMEKIVIENHAAVGKPEICRGTLAARNGLQFTQR